MDGSSRNPNHPIRDFNIYPSVPRFSLPSPSMADNESNTPMNSDLKRDSYGFTVRPQHIEIYKEYSHVYKVEEKERSEKWRNFIEHYGGSVPLCSPANKRSRNSDAETTEENTELVSDSSPNDNDCSEGRPVSSINGGSGMEAPVETSSEPPKIQTWIPIRPSIFLIEKMMIDGRVKSTVTIKDDHAPLLFQKYSSSQHDDVSGVACQGAKQHDNLYQEDTTTSFPQKETQTDVGNNSSENSKVKNHANSETLLPSKEELEFLVRGGVPKHLRGEIWQAFIGVQTRHKNKYYQNLVSSEMDPVHKRRLDCSTNSLTIDDHSVPEKIKKQIEKDLSRTFPGHPALDEDGRNSLRRILTAYARHNPSVGYCQAMNFFAGLFLLLMPEENAFWALVGIIDDYFDGYYTYDMIESQVDQLVFEELMREIFPKLVNHLDYLGVQVTWITSPWFISIFANMLPWETVLRIWDVLLFEGNRVMLFRSALALMELYGPVIITTKDSGEALTLLQSFATSTFDSSHLVITACMSFVAVTEDRLQELRNKHRPSVREIIEERTRGSKVSKESKSIATKLSSFKHGPKGVMKMTQGSSTRRKRTMSKTMFTANNFDEFICGISTGSEQESVPDLQDQVALLKAGISNILEERRLATMRAQELETAFTEMAKEDNRQQLSGRVEQLEYEVSELEKILASKQQQETKMLKVLMRKERQHKETEDARFAAEQEASSLRCAAQLLQEKYEKTMASLGQMEKKVVMAESLLEATRQYQSGQARALSSPPRIARQESERSSARKTGLLNFGMIWRDKNTAKPSNVEEPGGSG